MRPIESRSRRCTCHCLRRMLVTEVLIQGTSGRASELYRSVRQGGLAAAVAVEVERLSSLVFL